MTWPPVTHQDAEDEIDRLQSSPSIDIRAPAYGGVADGDLGSPTDNASAFAAALTAASAGMIIDLGGGTYYTGTTFAITKAITLCNGTIKATGRRCASIDTAGVTCRNVSFTRTTTAVGSDEGSAVYVQATNYLSIDCTYRSASRRVLYLKHGVCDGTKIIGGYCYPELAYQDCAGIYVQSGATGNRDIEIDGVRVIGNGSSPMGISIFDASHCTVRNSLVEVCRQIPDETYVSSGWTLVSGNVYSRPDRTDGSTLALLSSGTERTENTATPTNPGTNQWGTSGGTLYLNLGGTNPNTVTVISRIVSGYGIMLYSSSAGYLNMRDNRVINNRVRDTDGFGIYLQLGMIGARRNSTQSNALTSVCLKGRQSTKLPFAAIGVIGGSETSLINDLIDTVGNTSTYAAPGLRINPENATNQSSGTVIGMSVRNSSSSGITTGAGQWRFIGCKSVGNLTSGFAFWNDAATDITEAEFIGCEARENGLHGLNADASPVVGAEYRASVIGGLYHDNTTRNIAFKGTRSSKIIGATCYAPGASQYNIQIDNDNSHVIIDEVTLYSGYGINVNPTGNTDIVIGKITSDTTSTNQLTLGTGIIIRTDGRNGGVGTYMGAGSPETVVSAAIGSEYIRTDGGAGTSHYFKESGTGNTGWVAK